MPLRTRKIIYRSLLAVGLYATITQRTVPGLANPDGTVGGNWDDPAGNGRSQTSIWQSLLNAMREIFGIATSGWRQFLLWCAYLAGTAMLSLLTWRLFPLRRRKVQYV